MIVKYMKTGRKLTKENAAKTFGILNLRARICELRDAGVPIETVKNSRGLTAYTLA